MNILEDLQFRGLIYQISDSEGLAKRLDKGPITLYCGFDPSAESLHLGNLLLILILRRFQLAGHNPIAIAGGGTGLIGDPSGRTEERQLNAQETVEEWNKKIKKQIERFLDFEGKNAAQVINNYDWLGKIKIIEYLRDIGKHFSINEMLAKESVKARLEGGISFTEFNYMILQSIDFLELFQKYNCELQIGGSDQWGNIVSGVELIRKKLNQQAFCLTAPLITKSDGTKFGKTAGGAIWLDADMTSPYEFYQFWVNTSDQDVIKFIKYFTFLERDEISKLEEGVNSKPEERQAQKVLAYEVTKLVHGEDVAKTERVNSEAWFSKDIEDFTEEELEISFKNVPSYEINGQETNLVDLIVRAGIATSKRQAREDINNGAISINGQECVDVERRITKGDFLYKKYLVVKRGKKKYYLIKW